MVSMSVIVLQLEVAKVVLSGPTLVLVPREEWEWLMQRMCWMMQGLAAQPVAWQDALRGSGGRISMSTVSQRVSLPGRRRLVGRSSRSVRCY